jgi:hypothetical protein
MWPGDFCALLRRHLHPRWWSVWVYCDRWGKKWREIAEIPTDLATLFVAGYNGPKKQIAVVPQNQLPFWTQREVFIDRETGKETWSHAAKGWHPLMKDMLKEGHLRPSKEIGKLLGVDAWRHCKKEFWL